MRDLIRTRWAAVGAAVAVTLGAGGISLTQAAISSGEMPVYVSLDAPCRVIDTRESTKIGPGDDESLEVQITGANGECTGPLAIPGDAVGVSTNVTVIQPSDAPSGRSYFTVYPTGATRPVTSNLNFVNGQAPTPNKVDVGIGAGGKITIYNFEGTAHAAVDIFGYYIDHEHTGADIVDGSLTGADIGDGSLTGADIGDESLTGADVDDGSLTSADIRDEPGVAFSFNANTTALSNTVTRGASTSIRVPADGYAVVEVSGNFAASDVGEDEAWCQITKGGVPSGLQILVNTQPWVALNDHGDNGTEITGFSTHRVFDVAVADNPFSISFGQVFGFDCLEIDGVVSLDDVLISVTYYPRSYAPGGIILPLP